jgi:hypothetical protein
VRYIHARDVRLGRTAGFLRDQLKYTMFTAPLWIAGLWLVLFLLPRRAPQNVITIAGFKVGDHAPLPDFSERANPLFQPLRINVN